MTDRAVIFIDGNNWFHGLCSVAVEDRGRLDYKKISEKLVGPRFWLETRYYIGRINQRDNPTLYAQQRSFLAGLKSTDPRISVHFGRIEPRAVSNDAAIELSAYLAKMQSKIEPSVSSDLNEIARRHSQATVYVEKAVDVFLAVDLVTMALADSYDAAYVLSADGDYTPAVQVVRGLQKKVYAASCLSGAQLASVVHSFIRLQRTWFDDCYR
jgi:uncharacterized LabA/DUF88 family protein